MNNLEWFERVAINLEENLYDTCELMEHLIESDNLRVTTSDGEKHPTLSIEYYFEEVEFEAEPIVIHFDPYNQEFYTLVPTEDTFEVRIMLANLQDIVEFIHQAVHETIGNHMQSEFTEVVENFMGGNFNEEFNGEQFPPFMNKEGQTVEIKKELSHDDIQWLSDEVITTSEQVELPFKHENIKNVENVKSYRLGELKPANQVILAQFETIYIDGEPTSKQGALFPFKKQDGVIIYNLLAKHLIG